MMGCTCSSSAALGQGPKVLIAELLCGELGRALGLPVPELVFVELDGALGRNEPDGEVQELVAQSAGLNLALDFLPGALGFDALNVPEVDPQLASALVWFDALVSNVDRTPRNPNLLLWHRQLWLIDHGAALFFTHGTPPAEWLARADSPFAPIKEHIMLPAASALAAADARLAPLVTAELLSDLVGQIPPEWLQDGARPEQYAAYLLARAQGPRRFVQEAERARAERL